MAIIQCENGHFFDNSKYKKCPYCKEEKKNKKNKIQGHEQVPVRELDDQLTMAQAPNQRMSPSILQQIRGGQKAAFDEEKTVGLHTAIKGNRMLAGWLVCTKGNERGRDYRIYYGFNDIGRNHSMDICIADDLNVSPDKHCSIIYDTKKSEFHLLPHEGSITRVNQEMIVGPYLLQDGDMIELGMSEFTFVAFCKGERTWEEK